MKTAKVSIIVVFSFMCGIAVAQDTKPIPKNLKKAKITRDLLKKEDFVVRLNKHDGKEQVAGPQDGGACATTNKTSATTSHKGVGVECSVGGQTATCTCDLDCVYICENLVASESCTAKNCTVKLPGDTTGGGAAQVMPAF